MFSQAKSQKEYGSPALYFLSEKKPENVKGMYPIMHEMFYQLLHSFKLLKIIRYL
jgi:hypothetical protein